MFFLIGAYYDNMIERIKTLLSLIIIIICLPYLVTFVVQGDFLGDMQDEETEEDKVDENTDELVLMLANEMPLTYEKEALKAQAVIARTNFFYAKEHDVAEPEHTTREKLREKLGGRDFQKYYEQLISCVEETAGEYVTCDEKVVQLPYHFVSAGKTRELAKTGKKKALPYLKTVPSVFDFRSEQFLNIGFLSKKQFRNKLRSAYPDLEFSEDDVEKMVSAIERDSASYVLTMQLPGQKITGEDFKEVFSLNSTCFSVKEVDGQVRIVTKGYGQGYGMSQFGANEMAKDGSSYEQILKYYYDGIEIQRKGNSTSKS
jgi:stage II sporulation protein D